MRRTLRNYLINQGREFELNQQVVIVIMKSMLNIRMSACIYFDVQNIPLDPA